MLGDRDQMTSPKLTGPLAEALRARIVTLPSGHSLMSETPDALLAAVREAVVLKPEALSSAGPSAS